MLDDCEDVVIARLMCSMHYEQHRRAGSLNEVAPPRTAPCEFCGGPIPPGRRWGARFCSRVCSSDAKSASIREARMAARADRQCRWCRELISPKLDERAVFCSRPCSDLWRTDQDRLARIRARKAARKLCQSCQKPVPTERKYALQYCSYKCKNGSLSNTSPESRRRGFARNMVIKYGLSIEGYAHLLNEQDLRCAICRSPDWPGKDNRPHVDHCHASGKVRGLLCGKCNNGLGNFDEDLARFESATAYLKMSELALGD